MYKSTAVFEDLAVYLDSLSRMKQQFGGRAYPGHVGSLWNIQPLFGPKYRIASDVWEEKDASKSSMFLKVQITDCDMSRAQ